MTPRTDERINGAPCTRFGILAGNSLCDALVPSEFARTLELELAAEQAKVRLLRNACDQICEEWGMDHDTNPIGAGQRMATRASRALEATEDGIDQYDWKSRAEKAEAELSKYLSACPASPTEEERKRCQHWWATSGKSL